MATVNQLCCEIIEKVNNSCLDYNINQTPYSIHFSIRKKFSNKFKKSMETPTPSAIKKETFDDYSPQNNYLRQELLNTRNEYVKLHSFYQLELEARSKLESELNEEKLLVADLKAEIDELHEKAYLKEEKGNLSKKIKSENRNLQEKYENKCIELKNLKSEIENAKKERNSLSVALQGSKQEMKEKVKSFESEKKIYDKKISDLNDFKTKKLNQEREEKIKNKKELKKANRELKAEATAKRTKENFSDVKKSEDTAGQDQPAHSDANRSIEDSDAKNSIEDSDAKNSLEDSDAKNGGIENDCDAQNNIKDSAAKNSTEEETENLRKAKEKTAKFPAKFEDWSEEQKKYAYDNYFKLYMWKYLGLGSPPDD